MRLYGAAAEKGYPRAWRQLGSLYAKLKRVPDAIKAYKRYLRLSPGARDAQAIRRSGDQAIRRSGDQAIKRVVASLGGRP